MDEYRENVIGDILPIEVSINDQPVCKSNQERCFGYLSHECASNIVDIEVWGLVDDSLTIPGKYNTNICEPWCMYDTLDYLIYVEALRKKYTIRSCSGPNSSLG